MLKVFTTIPNSFIDSYFKMMYKEAKNKLYPIDADVLAKWLQILRDSLLKYIKDEYVEGRDYIVVSNPTKKGSGGHNRQKLFVNKDTFRDICMNTKSSVGKMVRNYFIRLDDLTTDYAPEINKAIEASVTDNAMKISKTALKDGPGTIYAILSGVHGVVKFGMTAREVLERIKEHNASRARKIRPLMNVRVDKRKAVEKCLKLILKNKQYRKDGEIYEVDVDILKKLAQSCSELANALDQKDFNVSDNRKSIFLMFVDENEQDIDISEKKMTKANRDCLLKGVPSRCYKRPSVVQSPRLRRDRRA